MGGIHQFAGQCFHLLIVGQVRRRLVQIEADEQHLGQSLAEAAVFGFGRCGQVCGGKLQIFPDEVHHLLLCQAGQRLFHDGIFQNFDGSHHDGAEHVIQGIGDEGAGAAHFGLIPQFLFLAEEAALRDVLQGGGATADIVHPTVAVGIRVGVVETGQVGGSGEIVQVRDVLQEAGLARQYLRCQVVDHGDASFAGGEQSVKPTGADRVVAGIHQGLYVGLGVRENRRIDFRIIHWLKFYATVHGQCADEQGSYQEGFIELFHTQYSLYG